MLSLFRFRCSECGSRLPALGVLKPALRCQACGTVLRANQSIAGIKTVVALLLLLPFSLTGAEKIAMVLVDSSSYADKKFILFLINLVLFVVIYPMFLRIRRDAQEPPSN